MPDKFPFIVDGIRGDVPTNFYAAPDTERGVLLNPTPGLLELCTLTNCTEVRDLVAYGNYLYAVARRGSQAVLWRIASDGTKAELGTITTSASGPAWQVYNSTQLCICDGVSGYVYTPSTGLFAQISDADFPGGGGVAYQDGYGLFFQPSSKMWFNTGLNDFTNINALDFYTKESKPSNIVSIMSYMREVWVFGVDGTEVWYNAGGDNSSPLNPTFARNTGGVVEYGCGAARSPSNLDGMAAVWLSDKGQLLMASGYMAQPISTQMFTRAVQGMALYSDARAFSYRDSERVFYQISFPTGDQTWVYDATMKLFHKRSSWKSGGGYGRHRANCYAWLGSKHYVGDYENGKVYEMSTGYYSDAGNAIRRRAYSQEIDGGLSRISFPSVQVIVEPGVGLVGGSDPQVILEFSGDGGNNWSNEVWRGAGLTGEYTRRAFWAQLGSGYRRMYRVTMTDAVLWRILGVDWGFK